MKNDNSTFYSGVRSTQFKYGINSWGGLGGIIHTYSTPQNFNGYFRFMMKGNCSVNYLVINDGSNSAGYIMNVYPYWASVFIDTTGSPTYGTVNPDIAQSLTIFTGGAIKTDLGANVDSIRFNPYGCYFGDLIEIWDGSTLKYKGVINPDLVDFVTTPSQTLSIDAPMLILSFMGIITSIFYWLRKTLVPGILSVLILLGASVYWLILETSLPVLAWVWAGIALANMADFTIRVAYTFGDRIADSYGTRFDFLRDKKEDED